MAAIDFPSTPTLNQQVTLGGFLWQWDGNVWRKINAGKSAYAIAVDNGFVGTESAWLASLVGDTGPTGATGATGPTGATGATGPVAGSANQIVYKDASNVATGSSGLTYDGVSLKVTGNLESLYSSGDEGGEIFLKKSATNTTLTNGVTIDINQNQLRMFENGGSNRGYYLDISAGGNGVSSSLVSSGSNALGLQLIASQAFSAATVVNVNNAFSATYTNYRVVIDSKNSANSTLYMRARSGGTDYTGNLYFTYAFNGWGNISAGDATQWTVGYNDGNNIAVSGLVLDFFRPYDSGSNTTVNFHQTGGRSGSYVYAPTVGGSGILQNSSYDGFSFYASTGNMTGTVRIYGVKN